MEEQARVIVLGDSLLMDSVAINLQGELALNVMRVSTSCIDDRECLKSLEAEMFIFELDAPQPGAVLSLLKELTDALFLAIDTNYSQVIELSSARHPIENMKELCQLAQTRLAHEKPVREEVMNQ
jgi:hypothetical protein